MGYTASSEAPVALPSLDACKRRCEATAQCGGVEFDGQRCSVWTAPPTVLEATTQSVECLSFRKS